MSLLQTERKTQIAEKATRLFRERGYAATSMRDLASAIGIEAASLYNHVRSKEELLHRICFELADAFFQARNEVESLHLAPPVKLRLAIEKHVDVITTHRDASAVFQHEWRHLSEPDLSVFRSMRDEYENYFANILREGVQKGHFRPADEKLSVLSLLSSLNWLYDWYRPDGSLKAHEIAAHQAELFINGIQKNN